MKLGLTFAAGEGLVRLVMIDVIHGRHGLLRVVALLALAFVGAARVRRAFIGVVAPGRLIVIEPRLRHVSAASLRSDL
jgi:hypothetical protein